MNDDDLKAFEDELKAMAPRPPSPRLRARLDALVDRQGGDRPRAGAASERFGGGVPWWRRHGQWLAMAAGLALAVAVYLWKPFQPPVPETLAQTPAEASGAQPPDLEVAAVGVDRSEEDPVRPRYRPVKARNSLKNRIDEGLVTLESGLAARRYRFQFVDTVVWENPSDGSQFEVSTPREELVLVPVHTF